MKIGTLNRIQITFWRLLAIFIDLRPRLHLPKYKDYPVAWCYMADTYIYPDNVRVIFEWDELGRHWIVFTRK